MRTMREIMQARNEAEQAKCLKRYLKINVVAGVLVGLALFAQDAFSGTWVNLHIGSKHIASDGYYLFQETEYRCCDLYYTGGYYTGVTWYEKVNYTFNERNTGIGIDHDVNEHVSLVAGTFINSFNIDTYYAGLDLHTSRDRRFQLGTTVGRVKGYEDTLMPTDWMVHPNAVYEVVPDHLRVQLGWLPGSLLELVTDQEAVDVLTFTVGFSF